MLAGSLDRNLAEVREVLGDNSSSYSLLPFAFLSFHSLPLAFFSFNPFLSHSLSFCLTVLFFLGFRVFFYIQRLLHSDLSCVLLSSKINRSIPFLSLFLKDLRNVEIQNHLLALDKKKYNLLITIFPWQHSKTFHGNLC